MFFTIDVKEISNQDDNRSVDTFRRLLWAEGTSVGVGIHQIHVSDKITVADGGIDALVENASPTNDDLIPVGTSGFQIKAQDNVSESFCVRELHEKKDKKKAIKKGIDEIIKNNGTYILVIFRDIVSPKRLKIKQAIEKELTDIYKKDVKVRVYTADELAGFIEKYPSLVSLLRPNLSQCLSYDAWSKQNKNPINYIVDNNRKSFSEEIQQKIKSSHQECLFFRITGLSGIGKTRFVFETLSLDDFKEKVVYLNADTFIESNLYYDIQTNEHVNTILVVDECSLQQHEKLVRSFSGAGSRLVIFSLSYENGGVSSPTFPYHLSRLDENSIKELLKKEYQSLPPNVIDRLSKFSDGFPRIATLLSGSFIINQGTQNEFISISDEGLVNRLIGDNSDTKSEHFKQNKKLLEWLSVFSKVGFLGDLSKESEWLAKMAGIDFQDYKLLVNEQRKREIIQGNNYILVTPFMLRIYLFRDWWNTYGFNDEKSFRNFIDSIPKEFRTDILNRFIEQIPFLEISEKGKEFVKDILGETGIFSDGTFLDTEFGSNFFLKLTESDSESALNCLERTISKWSGDKLLNFKIGRRNIVWALERIVMWKDLFQRATKLLLMLSVSENENYANNATGVFVDLFSMGYGQLASTEASPKERLPILEETLNSPSKDVRNIGLLATAKALESTYFVRDVGAENQGLKKTPNLWTPKKMGEIWDGYLDSWQLLKNKIPTFDDSEKNKAVKIILDSLRGLLRIPTIADTILKDFEEIIHEPFVDKKEVIKTVVMVLHYDGEKVSKEVKLKLEQIRDTLVGSDFSSQIKRYVGMDLVEDHFRKDGTYSDLSLPIIEKLAELAINDNKLLIGELNWLVSDDAKKGYYFGYQLGLLDKNNMLLPMILDTQANIEKNSGDLFIGGYFKSLFEKDVTNRDDWIDKLVSNKKLVNYVPGIIWHSGISSRSAKKLLEIAKLDIISASSFSIFGLGSSIENLDKDIFIDWIEFLLTKDEEYISSTILDLYEYFYTKSKETILPCELTYKVLTQPALFHSGIKRGQMDDYNWTEIGKKFVENCPSKVLDLGKIIIENFGNDDTILDGFYSETEELINAIAKKYPDEIWDLVSNRLGPPIDNVAFHLKEWLRGSEHSKSGSSGALSYFNPDKVFEWVDKKVDKRAWYLALIAPKSLIENEKGICWYKELLKKYGDLEVVCRELSGNYLTGSWTGPESSHFKEEKEKLKDFAEKNSDIENITKWVREMNKSMDSYIKRALIEEEKEGW